MRTPLINIIQTPVCLLTLVLAGCGARERNAPPPEQVRDAVSAALPPYLTTAAMETEPLATGPDEFKVNIKATITPKEDLFVVDRRVVSDPSILLIKPAQTIGSKTTIYGSLLARHTVDHWTVDPPELPDGLQRFGNPRSTFGDRGVYVTGSAQADQALKELSAHNDEVERQVKAKEEKERQASQAASDKKQREEQAVKDKLMRATSPGTRYLGTLTDPSTLARQRVRLTFVEQTGTLLRAEATNPDQPGDHRSLMGELVFKPEVDQSMNTPRAYPIQLGASGSAPAPTKGQWGFYNYSRGPLVLIPTEDNGLEGESIISRHYMVHLQREP